MRSPALRPSLRLLLALALAAGCSDGSDDPPPLACASSLDCPSETVCGAFACEEGACVALVAAPAGPVASQVAGDCRSMECDGAGRLVAMVDAADVPNDGNECTADSCSDGVPVNEPAEAASCDAGAGICSAAGACVECLTGAQCPYPAPECVSNRCVPPICINGVLDAVFKESDVDCGGPCVPCPDGASCNEQADCQSLHCSGPTVDTKVCQPASCGDGVANGDETDVDCGGPLCVTFEGGRCGDGMSCADPDDCESGVCFEGTCQAASCGDGVMNGLEEGIDCGAICGDDCLL